MTRNDVYAILVGGLPPLVFLLAAHAQQPQPHEFVETYHQWPFLLRHVPDDSARQPLVFLNGILQEQYEDYVIQRGMVQWIRQQPATTASVTVVYWGR